MVRSYTSRVAEPPFLVPFDDIRHSDHEHPPIRWHRSPDGELSLLSLTGDVLAGPQPVPHDSSTAVVFLPQPEMAYIVDDELYVSGRSGATKVSVDTIRANGVRGAGKYLFWSGTIGENTRAMVSYLDNGRWVSNPVGDGAVLLDARCGEHCSWVQVRDGHAFVVSWSPASGRREHRQFGPRVYPHGMALNIRDQWVGIADLRPEADGRPEIALWTDTTEKHIPGILADVTTRGSHACVLTSSVEDGLRIREFEVTCVPISAKEPGKKRGSGRKL